MRRDAIRILITGGVVLSPSCNINSRKNKMQHSRMPEVLPEALCPYPLLNVLLTFEFHYWLKWRAYVQNWVRSGWLLGKNLVDINRAVIYLELLGRWILFSKMIDGDIYFWLDEVWSNHDKDLAGILESTREL